MTPRMYPDLIDVKQELFELPQMVCPSGLVSVGWADMRLPLQERVIYNKEVQTMPVETEVPHDYEEQLRQRIYRERDVEADRIARDKALEEESVKLEQEIEQEIRGTYSTLKPCITLGFTVRHVQSSPRKNARVSWQRLSFWISSNNHRKYSKGLLMTVMTIFATIVLEQNQKGENSSLGVWDAVAQSTQR